MAKDVYYCSVCNRYVHDHDVVVSPDASREDIVELLQLVISLRSSDQINDATLQKFRTLLNIVTL